MSEQKAPHPFHPDRHADGTVRPGNQAARKHGVRAFEQRGEVALTAELRLSLDDFRHGVCADLGGLSNLTTLQKGYVHRLAGIEVCARMLERDLIEHGLHTKRGRVRSSYEKLLKTVAVWDQLAKSISQGVGAERRQRQIDPLEGVRLAVEEANRR